MHSTSLSRQHRRRPSLAAFPAGRAPAACVEPLESRQLLSGGTLDPSFGTGGKVFDNTLPAPRNIVVTQSDGKVLVAGTVNTDFYVARYNANGTPDATFGTNGLVTTDFSGDDIATDLVVQPDGKIVAVGYSGSATQSDFIAVRYNPDGTTDNAFGPNGNGKLAFDAGGGDQAYAIANAPGNKLVIGGITGNGLPANPTQQGVLVRLNSDGTPDSTFGTRGEVLLGSGASNELTFVYSIAVLANGSVVAGGATQGASGSSFLLEEVSATGTPVPNTYSPPDLLPNGSNAIRALSLAANGKLIAGGYAKNAPGNPGGGAIFRFNADGTPDVSFGANGHLTSPGDPGAIGPTIDQILTLPNGRILVSRSGVITRLTFDGARDRTFGQRGNIYTDFSQAGHSLGGMKLGTGNTVVAAGEGGSGLEIERFDLGASDTTAPTATVTARRSLKVTGPRELAFVVEYTDDVAVDPTTLSSSNILVTGPGGFSQRAALRHSLPQLGSGAVRGYYVVTAPAGGFANGNYTLTLQANQVADTSGNFVAAGSLGRIHISGLRVSNPDAGTGAIVPVGMTRVQGSPDGSPDNGPLAPAPDLFA